MLLITPHRGTYPKMKEVTNIVANFSNPNVGTNHTQSLYYTIEDHTSQLTIVLVRLNGRDNNRKVVGLVGTGTSS